MSYVDLSSSRVKFRVLNSARKLTSITAAMLRGADSTMRNRHRPPRGSRHLREQRAASTIVARLEY
jgi:hypothetical protein